MGQPESDYDSPAPSTVPFTPEQAPAPTPIEAPSAPQSPVSNSTTSN